MACEICNDKKYLVCLRCEDGREAIERCDACQWYGDDDSRTLSDEDVVTFARADGIACFSDYPCYII